METVSWTEATNYCHQLTLWDTAAGNIPMGSEYRLPTEAEWEYACRAWSSTRFEYGQDAFYSELPAYSWFLINSNYETHPVGSLRPNRWGCWTCMET
ncbi:MAG: SUMF1/EgtB/PvdO family nonheme iron enzyme [Bryobacterales bacterium]|nr:SUMF1/EgtB/PvdO family nonheme iron enzyme [Bryobacterales bacterium]